jgi:hypothetical protein
MTEQELEVMANENHHKFIKKVTETCVVYGLESEEGWATAISNHYDEVSVVPFWSESSKASAAAVEGWEGYEPVMVDMGDFLEGWLTGLHNDDMLVGTDWGDEGADIEKEPLDVILEILAVLKTSNKRIKLEVYKTIENFEIEIRKIKQEEMQG